MKARNLIIVLELALVTNMALAAAAGAVERRVLAEMFLSSLS